MKLSNAQPDAGTKPRAGAATEPAAAAATGPFVINLCSSTTPMALSQPHSAELKRFTFYVSRRLEDGRERFRLHMGHFRTLAEAEEWLNVVREVYPGAWAGEAPGKRLRQLAAQAAEPASGAERERSGGQQPSPASASVPAAARRAASTPTTAVTPPPPRPAATVAAGAARGAPPAGAVQTRVPLRAPLNIPTLQPATDVESGATPAERARVAYAQRRVPLAPAKPTRQQPAVPPQAATPQRPGSLAARAGMPKVPVANSAAVRGPTPKSRSGPPLSQSNVREVLASLDESGSTRQMQTLRLDEAAATPSAASAASADLSDSQVLRILENRRADGGRAEVDASVALLRPDDTATRRALHDAVASNAAVAFAVQLDWSVQPIDLARVPPLAIFSAYTLYSVEGSREGRRWYGLRLGFFSDAISAKQVAHYVRSEFTSVAVVPVSPQERNRASSAERSIIAKSGAPTPRLNDRLLDRTSEFKLIDDEPAQRKLPQSRAAQASAATPPVPAAGAGRTASPGSEVPAADAPTNPAASSSGASNTKSLPPLKARAPSAAQKRSVRNPAGGGRVVRAREKRSPQTLEETLEILGADQLEIDDGRGELLNDSGVRHLKVEVRKESPFMRLLDRLAERARRER